MDESNAAREALAAVEEQRRKVVDHAVPRWLAPALGAAVAAFFVASALGSTEVRQAVQAVFLAGFVAFAVTPALRRRREQRVRLNAGQVPPQHRRRAAVAGIVLLALLLGGSLGDSFHWGPAGALYGVLAGVVILVGGWWLRRRLADQLSPGAGR